MRKLPVFQSVAEVYSGVFRHYIDLLRVAWLPLLIWAVVGFLAGWWLLQHMVQNPAFLDAAADRKAKAAAFFEVMPWIYGVAIFKYLVLAIVAVGFHRFVLLGERRHGAAGTGFEFGRSEWLYIWSGIKIALLFVAVVAVVAAVGTAIFIAAKAAVGSSSANMNNLPPMLVFILVVGYVALVLCIALVASRLILVLPHVAIGQPSNLRFIWNHTRGNSWRILGYTFLVSLLAMVGLLLMLLVNWLLGMPMAQTPEALKDMLDHPTAFLIAGIVDLPIQIAWVMLTITMLSVAYREIIGLPADASLVDSPEPL